MALSATSRLFLNTPRDGDSTTSPGKPFQYFITLSVKDFPNIQPIFPLVQLKTVSSHSVTGCLGEGTDPSLATTTFQGAVESYKVTPESPFLQAE